jgi:RNA polymerase sigma factor (sigma-70 family)
MSPTPTGAVAARELSWTDERLVKECSEGNEAAWSALVEKYKGLIFSIPIKQGFSQEDAGEIFQAVCFDLLSELPRLRAPKALPKWLMQNAAHKCFHWKRRGARFLVSDDADLAATLRDPADAADALIQEVEEEQMLREAVAKLTPRCMELVRMLFFETPARPYEEIARNLGLATGSIGFVRGRCLDRLRKALEAAGFK